MNLPFLQRWQVLAGITFLTCACLLTISPEAKAQQPFVTDDADVTAKNKFHLELGNQFDILQRSAYPALRQNTADFGLNYGLTSKLELGVQGLLIHLFHARGTGPRVVGGAGDTSLGLKYNFYQEKADSTLPAMSLSLNLKLPTGDAGRTLGSGLVDFAVNMILQKSLTDSTALRVNGGVLFAGNRSPGDMELKERGRVLTGSTSLIKQVSEKVRLGAELAASVSPDNLAVRRQLQVQVGGNYSIGEKATFDFGVIAGRFPASPRIGGQMGFSIDF
jgi:hypothetical protein